MGDRQDKRDAIQKLSLREKFYACQLLFLEELGRDTDVAKDQIQQDARKANSENAQMSELGVAYVKLRRLKEQLPLDETKVERQTLRTILDLMIEIDNIYKARGL